MLTLTQPLTPELVLSSMTPGKTYVAHRLAEKVGTDRTSLRVVLAAMISDGRVQKCIPRGAHNTHFFIAGTYVEPEPIQPSPPTCDPAMVATRRAPPPLDRIISGYDAEIMQRVSLCMLARGAR